MAPKLEFKLVVSENGNEVLSTTLSYEAMRNIISNASDNKDNSELFSLAAKHPAAEVREQVAHKDNLLPDAIELLSKDKSVSVLRNIVRTKKFKESASFEELGALLALDSEIAESIARDVEDYTEVDTNKLAQAIAEHPDPMVVAGLAGNYSTPKKILKSLLKHSDPYVVSEAKERLND